MTRIAGIAAVAVCSLLLGMGLSPQDPPAKKGPAAERWEAAREIEKYAIDAHNNLREAPWVIAAEVEARVLWSRRFAETAIDAGALAARDAYGQHVARMEAMLQEAQTLFQAGRRSGSEPLLLRYHVADAKLLERSK